MKNLTPILLFGGLYLFFRSNDSSVEDAANRAIRDAQNAGEQPTYSDVQFTAIASTIHESLRFSVFADNKAQAERALLLMNKDIDVYKLIKTYGKRWHHMFGVPDGPAKDLPQAISGELSESRKANINRNYQLKGMTFRWV
ncbi:MAG: hypothetical protein AAFR66_02165 [Bacteroidota bacterium]